MISVKLKNSMLRISYMSQGFTRRLSIIRIRTRTRARARTSRRPEITRRILRETIGSPLRRIPLLRIMEILEMVPIRDKKSRVMNREMERGIIHPPIRKRIIAQEEIEIKEMEKIHHEKKVG
jgi:hypothetical protein